MHFSHNIENRYSTFKKVIPTLVLYLFINGLFVLKYVGRTQYSPVAALVLYIFAILLFFLSFKFLFRGASKKKLINSLIGLLSIISITIILLLHHEINPDTLNIDRWSAIHYFIQNLFDGIYPYAAQTHLGGYGSPFPIWQFFHIPFFLMGNISYAMIFSFLLFVIALMYYEENKEKKLFIILLLTLSPSFWYEAAARSDLFYNFILVFITILIIENNKVSLQKNTLLLGAICGLFMSTRISVIIPFFIFLFPEFIKISVRKKLTFIGTIFLAFALSFLPLILWDFHMLFLFEFNPFVLQSRQGNLFDVAFIIGISVFFSLRWQDNFFRLNEYIAFALFAFIAFTYLIKLISSNFADNIFSSAYDITYFNMGMPFLIYSLATAFLRNNEYSKDSKKAFLDKD